MRLLGLDGGFANLGFSVVEHDTDTRVLAMGLIRTQKGKPPIRATDDDVSRAREITRELQAVIASYRPQAVCSEAMSYPRNAANSTKMGIGWGIVSALAEIHRLAVVQASPQVIKRVVTGIRTASKERVAQDLQKRDPRALRVLEAAGIPKSKQHHCWDAYAAVVACLESDVVLAMARMEGGQR